MSDPDTLVATSGAYYLLNCLNKEKQNAILKKCVAQLNFDAVEEIQKLLKNRRIELLQLTKPTKILITEYWDEPRLTSECQHYVIDHIPECKKISINVRDIKCKFEMVVKFVNADSLQIIDLRPAGGDYIFAEYDIKGREFVVYIHGDNGYNVENEIIYVEQVKN